jgi:hypothetical protein
LISRHIPFSSLFINHYCKEKICFLLTPGKMNYMVALNLMKNCEILVIVLISVCWFIGKSYLFSPYVFFPIQLWLWEKKHQKMIRICIFSNQLRLREITYFSHVSSITNYDWEKQHRTLIRICVFSNQLWLVEVTFFQWVFHSWLEKTHGGNMSDFSQS